MTTYPVHPSKGGKTGLLSPVLESYRQSERFTMGVVQRVIERAENELDHCTVTFRGKTINATCCHPDITAGMSVCCIEQPRGVWWATLLQPSWYSRSVDEISNKPYSCALEYILRECQQWKPNIIIIDKRGQQIDDDDGTGGTDDGSKTGADGFNDWDGDDRMSRDEWGNAGHDPADFDDADANGDGYVDRNEYADWLEGENGDEWFQREGDFPFDPRDYRNSWFFFLKWRTASEAVISPNFRHRRVATQYSSSPFTNRSFISNSDPAITQPLYPYPYTSYGGATQYIGDYTRDFKTGATWADCALEYIAVIGSGGLASAIHWGDNPNEATWNETKAEAIASATQGAALTNAADPSLVVCNRGRYTTYALTFTGTMETGASGIPGYDESLVAYSHAGGITF